jgi:uncharacterized protein (DUF924 family)
VVNAESGARRRPWLGLASAMNRGRIRANQAHEHQRLVELFQRLGEEGETDLKKYAVGHKETIERFGRFPHRNEILGRESTAQEVRFLKEQNRSRVEA